MKASPKIVLLIFLLSVYVIYCLRGITPLLQYQLQKDYYSYVLCENKEISTCNGLCVVKNELKIIAEEHSDNYKIPMQNYEEIPSADFNISNLHTFYFYIGKWIDVEFLLINFYPDKKTPPPVI